MRIVVDTNVLISGAFFSGAPSKIVDACVDVKITLANLEMVLTADKSETDAQFE